MVGRAVLLAVTVLAVLAAPARSPAQDAGVSGIPPGPANARGLNGSVNDPSGIGNAARAPAIPPPDRYGVSWQVVPTALVQYLGGPDRAGAQRAMQAMMGMVKLDIAGLKRAYEGKSAA